MVEKKENIEIVLFGGEENKDILEKVLKSDAKIKFKNFKFIADDVEITFPSFHAQKVLLEKSIKEKSVLEQLMKGGSIVIEDFEASGEEIEITAPSFIQQIITAGSKKEAPPELKVEKIQEFKFDVSKLAKWKSQK